MSRGRRDIGLGGIGGGDGGMKSYGRKSYFFDGIDDRIERTNVSSISKNSAYSVCLSLNTSDVTTSQTVIANSNANDDLFAVLVESGIIRCGMYNGSSYFAKKSGNISIGLSYIIITFDGATTLKAYLNGSELIGTSNPNATVNQKLTLGSRTDAANPMCCYMWDVRIFNRVISSAEMTAYYAQAYINTPSVWYKTNEWASNTIAIDSSGNGLDGTITNADLTTFRHADSFGYKA